MRRDLSDWEQAEHHIIHYPRALLDRFSPTTHSFSEFSTARDLAVAERIYERAYLVEEAATKTPPLVFGREFNMTDDSHLFTTSEALEAQGYHVDTYGRFRRGEELMLPLYQGVMIWQLDSAARFWGQTASGSKAWMLNEGRKVLRGRVCLRVDDVAEHHPKALRTRIGIRDVQNATNQRTMIGAVIPGYPCPHSMPTMSRGDIGSDLVLLGALTSFPFDWLLRIRMSQNHVSWFYLANLPLPKELESPTIAHYALRLCARLALATEWFSPEWLLLRAKWSELAAVPWQSAWAATPHERLRLRCQLDALVALCYGLTAEDLGWILRDCDWSSGDLTKRAESLDAKGFWRVDRHLDPELRHTVLALVALRQLEEAIRSEGGDRMAGISTFFAANDGEGWIVPESVCLKEYGLGHDERSNAAQPVRSRLGERFYSWQLEQSVEESWAECQRHARDLLGANGYARLTADIEGYRSQPLSPSSDTVTEGSAQKRLFPGKPSLFDDGTEDPV
jgi:hypothetical protein